MTEESSISKVSCSEVKQTENIRILLDNYRQYHLSNNQISISDNFLNNKMVFESSTQLPDILIKKKRNPYFDQNQSFYVPNQQRNNYYYDTDKIIIKEYIPNYFIQKQFKEEEKENLLITIRKGFEYLSDKIEESHKLTQFEKRINADNLSNQKDNFLNIDIELELNYEMLNHNNKWCIFVPGMDVGLYGPFGTADAYMFVKTKEKNIFSMLKDFLVVDMDNECFLSCDLAIIVLAEEIMNTVKNNEIHNYFYRHAVENHYDHPVTRMFVMERKKNKFDRPKRNL